MEQLKRAFEQNPIWNDLMELDGEILIFSSPKKPFIWICIWDYVRVV